MIYKIWDNAQPDKFTFPVCDELGVPGNHKFTSTAMDNLCELAGRVCYDSIDSTKGKPSKDYHAHIREVKHDSIYGHAVLPVYIESESDKYIFATLCVLSSRPGITITEINDHGVHATVNLRSVLQWHGAISSGEGKWQHGPELNIKRNKDFWGFQEIDIARHNIINDLIILFKAYCPLACEHLAATTPKSYNVAFDNGIHLSPRVELCRPDDKTRWISVYINGVSRDMLQELVRHHYQTGISVRSTRYCDESDSKYITHPALAPYPEAEVIANKSAEDSRRHYKEVFDKLKEAKVPLKTARGAARSVLPGGTETQMVYTASLQQWRWILSMRDHPAADKEIADFAIEARKALEL